MQVERMTFQKAPGPRPGILSILLTSLLGLLCGPHMTPCCLHAVTSLRLHSRELMSSWLWGKVWPQPLPLQGTQTQGGAVSLGSPGPCGSFPCPGRWFPAAWTLENPRAFSLQ